MQARSLHDETMACSERWPSSMIPDKIRNSFGSLRWLSGGFERARALPQPSFLSGTGRQDATRLMQNAVRNRQPLDGRAAGPNAAPLARRQNATSVKVSIVLPADEKPRPVQPRDAAARRAPRRSAEEGKAAAKSVTRGSSDHAAGRLMPPRLRQRVGDAVTPADRTVPAIWRNAGHNSRLRSSRSKTTKSLLLLFRPGRVVWN